MLEPYAYRLVANKREQFVRLGTRYTVKTSINLVGIISRN
jgi:hypothetical protein